MTANSSALHPGAGTVDTAKVGRSWFVPLVAVLALVLAACTTDPSREASSSTTTTRTPSTTPQAPSRTTVTPSTSRITPSTVPGLPPEEPTGAVQFTPTAADLAAIGNAYAQFTGFSHCPVEPVSGQLKAAVITATGVKWAFGQIQPAAGCTVINDGKRYSADIAAPFSDADYRKAVFTEQPGGTWSLNWFESNPFPCPADLRLRYQTPGPGTPYVPLAVLNAVGVPWSSSPKCDTPLEYVPVNPNT